MGIMGASGRSDGARSEGASTPLGASVLDNVRRLLASRRGRVIVVVTLLLGLVGAVAVTMGSPAALRTFAFTSLAVQLLMSVTVPFLGVLLTSELRRAGRGHPLTPRLVAAAAMAAASAVFGVVVSVAALGVASSDAPDGAWRHVGVVVLGSILVQVIAQLAGTGLGMLIRPPAVAMAATIVLPLGLWLILGSVDGLRPAQGWLAPFASAANLLSGPMTPLQWAQVLVVVLVWNVGLNAVGANHLGRSTRPLRRLG